MTCRPLRQEPSLSSMKENAFASRRVRTQPCRRIESAGWVALRASLTSVRDMAGGGGKGSFMTLANRKRGRQRPGEMVPEKIREKGPIPAEPRKQLARPKRHELKIRPPSRFHRTCSPHRCPRAGGGCACRL